MSTTLSQERVVTIFVYAAIGAVYGASGYTKKVMKGDKEIRLRKFGKTLLIGAAAGGIVAAQGDDLTPGTFEAAMVLAVPLVDQLWNGIADVVEARRN